MPNFKSLGLIVFFLVIVALASFLGFKLYVDYQVKKKVDEVIQSLWSVAKVEYKHVAVGLDGRITLSDIIVRPFEINDEIKIQSVEVMVPDLEFLLDVDASLAAGRIPEQMTLEISGVEVNPAGGLLQTTKKSLLVTEGVSSLCLSEDAKYSILRELGYTSLQMNMSMGYTYDLATSSMRVFVKGHDEGISEYDAEFTLHLPLAGELARGQLGSLRLVKAGMNYIDMGYHQKLISYCSAQLGLTADKFIAKKVSKHGVGGIPGLSLGKALREGYRKFLVPGGRVNISINPLTALNPVNMVFYTPKEIVDTLNLSVLVNGEAVTDLTIDVIDTNKGGGQSEVKAPAETLFGSVPSLRELAEKALGGEPITTPGDSAGRVVKAPVARFVPVEISGLTKHIGKGVRVLTVTGFVRSGRLDGVVDGEIIVSWPVGRGEMAANIPANRIKGVELVIWE